MDRDPTTLPSLLILDSATPLVAPLLGGDFELKLFSGKGLMSHLAAALRRLALLGVAVLITNESRDDRDYTAVDTREARSEPRSTAIKPALGRGWVSVPGVRLLLTADAAGRAPIPVTATLVRHPRSPVAERPEADEPLSVDLLITERGVEDEA